MNATIQTQLDYPRAQLAYAIAHGCMGCGRKDVPLYGHGEHAECDDCSDLGKEGAEPLKLSTCEGCGNLFDLECNVCEESYSVDLDGDDWQIREAGMR